ncbi:rhomboid-related protein 2 [Lepeophtheirus salmonis]|uniref:Peptidase S54 rhomboid domain-containing protein n=2 Tax=Lepeophtheirus salmonis TaxID=72036 RepID=A0A0K2UKA3_LEPSM|nr:rhomboid-related protein 2-like [Lepeophtheirus salmonis]
MTKRSEHLESVFRQLDYLDDAFEDGSVSHVGLRRIILETPELEAEIGSALTRTLLNRAERNLYGRISYEEFLDTYSEVLRYQMAQTYSSSNTSGSRNPNNNNNHISPQYASRWNSPITPKGHAHYASVKLAIPKSERSVRLSYLDQYSCLPPPIFLFLISLVQIGIFTWHAILLTNMGKTVGPNEPVYLGYLIFNPFKKREVWRFVTYMFVHSGYFHLTFNILVQLLLGIPLEMVHRWWRVLLIYFCGGIAGSLLSSLTDGTVYIAGASGGVYALITAHLANVIFNWKEMEYPILRLLAFLLAMGIDIGVAIYYRYGVGVETKTAYAAHLGGAIVGLLLGIVILRNIRVRSWERVIWWLCLLAVLALFLVAIVWNAVNIGLYEGGSL